MVYDLVTIDFIIGEHEVVKENLERMGSSINDLQALVNLQKALCSAGVLTEKRKNLQELVSLLEEGIAKHFTYEEKMLPPIFGRVLMQALTFEHQEIKKAIEEVKSAIFGPWPEGIRQEEVLAMGRVILQTDRLCQMIEEHARRENTILKMMKRALEGGNQNQGS